METQPSFSLNAAIENWRQELSTQTSLTAEARRELETHLRDTISEMQQRGLNEEESFWVAQGRIGKLKGLDQEFAKADPLAIWRERVLWIFAGSLAIQIWSTIFHIFWDVITPSPYSFTSAKYLHFTEVNNFYRQLIYFSSIGLIAALVAKGRFVSRLTYIFRSRRTFVTIASLTMTILNGANFALMSHRATQAGGGISFSKYNIFFFFYPAIDIAIVAWLMPSAKREQLTASEQS